MPTKESRQHVGPVPSEGTAGADDELEIARARQQALAALTKPQTPRERGRDYGDGDRCPSHPHHGKMYVLGKVQYCAHVEHEGRPRSHAAGEAPRTRALWPLYLEKGV